MENYIFHTHSYKDEGILFPSGEKQEKLMREFYADLKLDPAMIGYVEAHGTGTKVGRDYQVTPYLEIYYTFTS